MIIRNNNTPKTKVITGPRTLFSYVNVIEPQSVQGGSPKYSISLIVSKDDTTTVEALREAIKAAYEDGLSKLKGTSKTVPPLEAIKTPLRDGDLERPQDPAYANSYFVNASSKTPPGIVDANRQAILEPSEIYSGIRGRAAINMFAYNVNGSKGIGCALLNLQKISDGAPLGGKLRAEDEFANLDGNDDEFLG